MNRLNVPCIIRTERLWQWASGISVQCDAGD